MLRRLLREEKAAAEQEQLHELSRQFEQREGEWQRSLAWVEAESERRGREVEESAAAAVRCLSSQPAAAVVADGLA